MDEIAHYTCINQICFERRLFPVKSTKILFASFYSIFLLPMYCNCADYEFIEKMMTQKKVQISKIDISIF